MNIHLPKRLRLDIIISIVSISIISILLRKFDAFEVLVEFTRAHESWELDELILAMLVSPIFISWIAIRLWRESLDEIHLRKKREQELLEIQKVLEHNSGHDMLTGLPNRNILLDQMEQVIASCRRHGHHAALLYIDLDCFKNINDSVGHTIGDKLLQEVGERLKIKLRKEDFAARLNGDEFIVVFAKLSSDKEEAIQLTQQAAKRLQDALSEPLQYDGHHISVTSSIGITMIPEQDEEEANEDVDEVLKRADIAMHRAKNAGGNSISFFTQSMQHRLEERIKIQNDLYNAIVREEFHLHFQPKTDTKGKIIGAEALLRWQHPEVGNVVPGSFIPIAEETGQILEIGQWVLTKALTQLKIWQENAIDISTFNLSVNVSPQQFRQPDFVGLVERTLVNTGASPESVTLELTENVLVENLDDTITKIKLLKRLGIRFSIDDFGTGYSSLAYLKRLPIDELKIDQSFIRDLDRDSSDANLVETIIVIAGHFSLDVVAEGVETEQQLSFLTDKGCRYFQGYYFGRPQSSDDFTAFVENKRKLKVWT